VLDSDSLPSNWGDPVKGIRAGLSVDSEKVKVGERVLLHLRWENINASDLLGQGECREPLPEVEIQDSQHHVLKTLPTYIICNSHGWGPFGIEKGKPQHIFREFTTAGDQAPSFGDAASPILPGPGVYFLVAVWSSRVLENVDAKASAPPGIGAFKFGAVYAVARSTPVRIEVLPRGNP
jgi:hypothetical protein